MCSFLTKGCVLVNLKVYAALTSTSKIKPSFVKTLHASSLTLMPKKPQPRKKGPEKTAVDGQSIDQSGTDPIQQNSDGTVTVKILAKPGAKQTAITDITQDGVGLQISAPPVDGEANVELVKFMAKTLGVRKSDVMLHRGSKSRSKLLVITGKSRNEVEELISSQTEQ